MIELSVENLHLDYGDNPVLKGVSMQLQRGEVVSLLGPSGSGKTTLLRAVAGLEAAKKGRITINDRVLFDSETRSEVPAELRDLGIVFQSYALWPHKTVAENIAYPLKLRKVKAAEQRTRVQDILNQLGLGKLGQRYPHELSGGQQQRVAIGRALVYNPPVLLLDEPLSNLDAKLREEARAFLRELIMRLGLSAIMVTHDQNEAMAISDRILLLNNGKIEQQGTPQEMYGSPTTLFCAEFMGSNNILQGTVSEIDGQEAVVQGQGWRLRGRAGAGLQQGQPASAIIRVEQLRLGSDAGVNSMQLPLVTSMYLGDKWEYLFRAHGADAHDALVLRAYGNQERVPGQCHLELPPEHVWVFPS
ncbi:ABC transporter ATP-binding protein [Pollutimonas bauzanensis]|uniref:Iron(III) transport system ATP-binding protein n=1 Tax=Pollutimonas bauzanensis TaxID=658167 RepID=A0A1M5YES5_9BURK|nr:ABC transporter ATP-binding protein [Pollutimonas bauzanensis]SHI10409.1 iron(III) transport system ATP-binding protein [Pollutimonas bauzanensis]